MSSLVARAIVGASLTLISACGGAASGGSSAPGAPAVRLRTHVVMDDALGMEASRFLVPIDWKVEGGIKWRAVPSQPATSSIRVFNPAGVEEIGVLPNIPCLWTQRPVFGIREGSTYLGAEVRRPIENAVQCLRKLVLPRAFPKLKNATVVQEDLLPEKAKAWAAANFPGMEQQVHVSAGKIRIEYAEAGKMIEQDLYCVVSAITLTAGGVPTTYWGPDDIKYSRAEKGKLDEQYKLFHTMIASDTPNLRWVNRYTQISEQMVRNQIAASNRALELSRYLSQTNDQIRESIRASYETRQAAMDRVNLNFDRHIRGVEAFQDPWGHTSAVELPSGYSQAWSNANGEYIMSNDANFNPNVGSNTTWRAMKKPG
jgi:hypothetical protein